MSKSENVKIPLLLLTKIIDLLDYWEIDGYDPIVQNDFDLVYRALQKKQQNLELRDAYAKIVHASNEDTRHAARIQYLQQKHLADDFLVLPSSPMRQSVHALVELNACTRPASFISTWTLLSSLPGHLRTSVAGHLPAAVTTRVSFAL